MRGPCSVGTGAETWQIVRSRVLYDAANNFDEAIWQTVHCTNFRQTSHCANANSNNTPCHASAAGCATWSAPAAKEPREGALRCGLLLLGRQAVREVGRLNVVQSCVQENGAEGDGAQRWREPAHSTTGDGGRKESATVPANQ